MDEFLRLVERAETLIGQAEEVVGQLQDLDFERTAETLQPALEKLNSATETLIERKTSALRMLVKLSVEAGRGQYEFEGPPFYRFYLSLAPRDFIGVDGEGSRGAQYWMEDFARTRKFPFYEFCVVMTKTVSEFLQRIPSQHAEELQQLNQLEKGLNELTDQRSKTKEYPKGTEFTDNNGKRKKIVRILKPDETGEPRYLVRDSGSGLQGSEGHKDIEPLVRKSQKK